MIFKINFHEENEKKHKSKDYEDLIAVNSRAYKKLFKEKNTQNLEEE